MWESGSLPTLPLAGMELAQFYAAFGADRPLIAAIVRGSSVIVPRGKDKPLSGDLIIFCL